MINLETDEVITLSEAAKRLPKSNRGKKPHLSTIFRWSKKGVAACD